MKRTLIYLLMLIALSLVFAGCAQVTGDCPASETGGGDDGYGVGAPGCMLLDTAPADIFANGFENFDYWRV
jgi:hypothetical protein